MSTSLNRRTFMAAAGAGLTTAAAPAPAAAPKSPTEPFGYCFNTSTIQWKPSPFEEIDIAAEAGYHGFEPWVRELDKFVHAGGSLKDLAKRVRDRGLVVADVIGFVEWIVDDEARRHKGLEEAKRVMGMCQELGSPHLAAPPVGATNQPNLDLLKAAERYAALCKVGEAMDVTPMVEHWGHSKSVRRLGEAVLVAMESGVPRACVLPDVFHLYKGGSNFTGIKMLGRAFPILHVNDYPAYDRATIKDAQRVYPGDGVAPLKELFRDLRAIGFRGMLSLELFNPDYWKLDPRHVAKTGLDKVCTLVRSSV